MIEGKSFKITQEEVLVAYKKVRAYKRTGGVDRGDFTKYQKNLRNNLYKMWNTMSSGSYFPREVRGVRIPSKNGGMRLIGVPTIEDRIAQMIIRNRIEPRLEDIFLDDSYGNRPNKSAIDAIGHTRNRCFKMPWVIEYEIVGLFDNINHKKLMRVVRKHVHEKWIILYIKRFLKAPMIMPDGTRLERNSGIPQGGEIGPVLANLFMHYAFDKWITKEFPRNPWTRYADDGVIHCWTLKQAKLIMAMLKKRMEECELEVHTGKSKIISCRNAKFELQDENELFDILGYTFRARQCKGKRGPSFMGYTPTVSKESGKRFREKIRTTFQQIKQHQLRNYLNN